MVGADGAGAASTFGARRPELVDGMGEEMLVWDSSVRAGADGLGGVAKVGLNTGRKGARGVKTLRMGDELSL